MKSRIDTNKFRLASLFFVLSVLFCGYSSVFPQKKNSLGWVWQNPLPQGNPLYSVYFAKDKETGYAVGADSTVLRTENGGFGWSKQKLPIETTLSGVFVKDKKNAVVVGARGSIFLTANAGKDWTQSLIEAKDHLYSVTFTDENFQKGWSVGTYGRILKTQDGGLTWENQTSGTTENLLKTAFFDDSNGIVVGLNGTILTTKNGGENWKSNKPCENFFDVERGLSDG